MPEAYRASILHFLADPDSAPVHSTYQYYEDGLLVVEDGRVAALGSAETLLEQLGADVRVSFYNNSLIVPGFIDCHTHFPQTQMIASYGAQLLEWLETYTFPVETRFSDPRYARTVADRFLDELLRAGTTTAMVFGTVHRESVDAYFEACELRNLRMIAGKSLMDRNGPDELLDTPDDGYAQSAALIEKWHNRGRARYAVTPRFAATSSPEQLRRAGQLLAEYPDVYMQTHLAENPAEVRWVEELFPQCKGYLDTYAQAGLLGERSVFAHCLHLQEQEWMQLGDSVSNIAFCPTSNLFLGSGLFHLARADSAGINVGLGTDVGAGTSLSMLQTLNEAYKVLQLRGETLSPLRGFYLATLGGAKALDLADLIGNFATGKEADFVVLDRACTPLMDYRQQHCKQLSEQLFVFSMLGDDRAVSHTYAAGKLVHDRDNVGH